MDSELFYEKSQELGKNINLFNKYSKSGIYYDHLLLSLSVQRLFPCGFVLSEFLLPFSLTMELNYVVIYGM